MRIIFPKTSWPTSNGIPGLRVSSPELLTKLLIPNQTTLVDIEMKRIVHEGVFQLTQNRGPEEFKVVEPGGMVTR